MAKICFISLDAYSLFNKQTNYYFGGAEVRTIYFAKALAKHVEHDVSVIVRKHLGQLDTECYDDVTVHAHPAYQIMPRSRAQNYLSTVKGLASHVPHVLWVFELRSPTWSSWIVRPVLRLIRNIFKRMLFSSDEPSTYIGQYFVRPEKLAIYEMVDADIYCALGTNPVSAELAAYCRQYDKIFLHFSAHDIDFQPAFNPYSLGVNMYKQLNYLCYYAWALATVNIVQTQHQADLLYDRKQREAIVIPNPIDLEYRVGSEIAVTKRSIALWVGKSDEMKDPKLLLRLATQHPEISFVMVMTKSKPSLHTQVLANHPQNVIVHEYIPFSEIEKLFCQARIFISTSKGEGIANTFLQAAKYGVPILSWQADPDNFIVENTCGVVAKGDFEQLTQGLKCLWQDDAFTQQCSENILAYVHKNHAEPKIARLLYELIQQVSTTHLTSRGE